jgi:outer membrane protein OmpA-like peptidoglycan-associated protein
MQQVGLVRALLCEKEHRTFASISGFCQTFARCIASAASGRGVAINPIYSLRNPTMKNFTTTTVLAAAGALLLAASASAGHAPNHQKVVHSTNGGVVFNSFGDCVVTKWEATSKECNALTNEMRTVYFEFNSSGLTGAAKGKLNTLAANLRSNHVRAVSIVGFADEIGSESYNQRLSEKRANAVAAYLRGKGIKVDGKSEVRGLGETSSRADCSGKNAGDMRKCLWRDRRVEVEIVQ